MIQDNGLMVEGEQLLYWNISQRDIEYRLKLELRKVHEPQYVVHISLRLKILKCGIFPTLVGAETWALTEALLKQL